MEVQKRSEHRRSRAADAVGVAGPSRTAPIGEQDLDIINVVMRANGAADEPHRVASVDHST
jgi:hypothetical protein